MGFYDWMLALHLLAAFSIAAALVLYTALVVAGRRMTTLEQSRVLFRVAPIGGPLIGAGMGLTLLLGVILAIDADDFEIWTGWVIAGIVLWAVFAALGRQSAEYYMDVRKRAESGDTGAENEVVTKLRAPRGAVLQLLMIGVFVLIVLDMIFKPGA